MIETALALCALSLVKADINTFQSAATYDLVGGHLAGNLWTDSLYLGCFSEPRWPSALPYLVKLDSKLSGEDVIIACYNAAVDQVSALSTGTLCSIGPDNARFQAYGESSGCNLPCGTNSSSNALCGGNLSTMMYQVETEPSSPYANPLVVRQGCFDTTNMALTANYTQYTLDSGGMSHDIITVCQQKAAINDAIWFALSEGNICTHWAVAPNMTLFNILPVNKCKTLCTSSDGNNAPMCGGANAMSLFRIGESDILVNGTTFNVPVSRFNQYMYMGCFYQAVSGVGNLHVTQFNADAQWIKMNNSNGENLVQQCHDLAKIHQTSSFTITNGTFCIVGKLWKKGSMMVTSPNFVSDSFCDMDCNPGTPNSQKCGGLNYEAGYSMQDFTGSKSENYALVSPFLSAKIVKFQGCFPEIDFAPLLNTTISVLGLTSLRAANDACFTASKGAKYYGLANGVECRYGDIPNMPTMREFYLLRIPDQFCNMLCGVNGTFSDETDGNAIYRCGGVGTISMYYPNP